MRVTLPLIALACAGSAAADVPQLGTPMLERKPAIVVPAPNLKSDAKRVCTDRIQQVRAERGLPTLDRDNATGDEPLLILAVDRRIDGCSVMVMAYDANDIRPVPTESGERRLRKIQ